MEFSNLRASKKYYKFSQKKKLRESGLVVANKRITLAIRSTYLSSNATIYCAKGMSSFHPGEKNSCRQLMKSMIDFI